MVEKNNHPITGKSGKTGSFRISYSVLAFYVYQIQYIRIHFEI